MMQTPQSIAGLAVSAASDQGRTCAACPDMGEIAQQRLRTSPYMALRDVQCQFQDGVLILTGDVPNYYTKQIAQELLRNLDQVRRIDNRLAVTF